MSNINGSMLDVQMHLWLFKCDFAIAVIETCLAFLSLCLAKNNHNSCIQQIISRRSNMAQWQRGGHNPPKNTVLFERK